MLILIQANCKILQKITTKLVFEFVILKCELNDAVCTFKYEKIQSYFFLMIKISKIIPSTHRHCVDAWIRHIKPTKKNAERNMLSNKNFCKAQRSDPQYST